MVETESKGMGVVFSNQNYAFDTYHQLYIDVCMSISKTMDIRKIGYYVSTFIYEFCFVLGSNERRTYFKKQLNDLSYAIQNDDAMNYLRNKDAVSFREEVGAYPLYYGYFLAYLKILGTFVSELGSTFMPRMKLQQKLVKYKNDSPFYQKLQEYKRQLFEELSNFSIIRFREKFNLFITYIYAYELFINQSMMEKIEEILSNVLTKFSSQECISILNKFPDFSKNDMLELQKIEDLLFRNISECNSLINASFSLNGVLINLIDKEYGDYSGI